MFITEARQRELDAMEAKLSLWRQANRVPHWVEGTLAVSIMPTGNARLFRATRHKLIGDLQWRVTMLVSDDATELATRYGCDVVASLRHGKWLPGYGRW